jgi:hypothetical protein
VIIGAASALTCGLIANRLLRMITVGLKDLPAVKATAIHWAAPEKNERGSFSLDGTAMKPGATSERIQRL